MNALSRFGIYVIAFFVLLAVSAYLPLSFLDYSFYRQFFVDPKNEVELQSNEILLIDLPGRKDNSDRELGRFRKRLADLLIRIADRGVRPKAVILDYYFGANEDGIDYLVDAIGLVEGIGAANHDRPVSVYRVLDLKEKGRTFDKVMYAHNALLYENPALYAHSIFTLSWGVLSYKTMLAVESNLGAVQVPAMPVRATIQGDANLQALESDTVLALGDADLVERITYSFVHEDGQAQNGEFRRNRHSDQPANPGSFEKYIVIGSLLEDNEYRQRSGPELLVWAISDRLSQDRAARQPLNQPAILIGQIVFFGLLTAIIYALLFAFVKRLKTRAIVIALLAAAIAGSLLVVYVGIILLTDHVAPVGHTLIAILLSAGLSASFAYKFLVTAVVDGSGEYDIFISYSRGHGDWVVEHVYQPLQAMRKPDGTPLNIFFDRDKIGAGEAFTSKYMWAIVNSTHFLPVFSSDYYGKHHCRNEMDLAYKRFVEKKIHLLPVMHEGEVPAIYTTLNYMDAGTDPGFMKHIEATLLK